jgi:hypothetical protein
MKLTMVVAIFGAMACATQALRPAPGVPDYISELPQLPHCKDSTFKNVGSFSVSRVRCGCNDDEEKVGKHLGHTYIGPWKVKVYSAYCVPEGTGKELIMCKQMMPPKCAKPGLSGPSKCGACGCDCTFVSVVAKNPPRLRHKKKSFFDELEDEQIGWNEDPYDDDFDEIDNHVGEPLLCHSRRGRNCGYLEYKNDWRENHVPYSSWRSDHPRGSYGGNSYDESEYFDIEEEEDEHVGGGICGYPRKYPNAPPSHFLTMDAYDRYVCKNKCGHAAAVCIFHTPNCGRPNIGDRERAMQRRCHSTKASCERRC